MAIILILCPPSSQVHVPRKGIFVYAYLLWHGSIIRRVIEAGNKIYL